MNEPISKREGLMLYWAEGDKPSRNSYKVALTNTDPVMLKAFVYWLKTYYNVPNERLRVRVALWDENRENEVLNFWSRYLGIPRSQFMKTSFRSPKDSRKNQNNHKYGICRVSTDSKKLIMQIMNDLKEIKTLWGDLNVG